MILEPIRIPEPILRQFKNEGPRFIQSIPPDMEDQQVRVKWMIHVYINEPQNHHVRDFLNNLEIMAKTQGLEITRYEDFKTKEFVYNYHKVGSPPPLEAGRLEP